MKKILFVPLCFLCVQVWSQDYHFGKVSGEELTEKFNPKDSAADATYLYKYRKTFFEYDQDKGFEQITEIHERIKIYNNQGFRYATQQLYLYTSGGDEEKISGLKGYTYNIENGNVEETKLKKEGIFETKHSKYYNAVKFTMPNIKDGSVIEYKYRIRSPFLAQVDEFIFQHEVPVRVIEAKFETPEYLNYRINTKGFLNVAPQVTKNRDYITFNYKTRSGKYNTKTRYGSDKVEYVKTISSFNLKDIPALKKEPYVNNMNNYMAAAKYELSYTKFPDVPMKYYTTTWEDVVKTIYRSSSFGDELNKTGYFEKDIDALLDGVSGANEKIARIYDYVKSNVNWNSYRGIYTSDGVRKAYKEHSGNVAEINLMLTAMLRYAKINANPVLVSTRDHGIPLFPTRDGYDYVICGVEVPNAVVLLDASDKFSTPDVLPLKALNWKGRIIRKDGSSALIDLYPKKKSKKTVLMNVTLDENGDIKGKIRNVNTSHLAMRYRQKYNETNEEDFLDELQNRYGDMEIDNFELKNNTELMKPTMESYTFYKEGQAEMIGDKVYFSPLFFLRTKENPFKLPKREFPVDFGYPSEGTYRIAVNLPENYTIEKMPEPIVLTLPDNLGSFKFNLKTQGNMLQVLVETETNEALISPLYYNALKEYFKKLIEKENEQVILKRI